jgi:hypothetical protein
MQYIDLQHSINLYNAIKNDIELHELISLDHLSEVEV